MKFLALILVPLLSFAQDTSLKKNMVTQDHEREESFKAQVKLFDQTNPQKKEAAKNSADTQPEKRSIASKKISRAQYCFDISATSKEVTWKYDQSLQGCVNDLYSEGEHIGYADCQKIANEITDGSIRNNIKDSCEENYGYEGCMQSGQQTALDCLRKHASSLSYEDCEAELKAKNLAGNKEASKLCEYGNIVNSNPTKPGVPGRGRRSSR